MRAACNSRKAGTPFFPQSRLQVDTSISWAGPFHFESCHGTPKGSKHDGQRQSLVVELLGMILKGHQQKEFISGVAPYPDQKIYNFPLQSCLACRACGGLGFWRQMGEFVSGSAAFYSPQILTCKKVPKRKHAPAFGGFGSICGGSPAFSGLWVSCCRNPTTKKASGFPLSV